MTKPATETLPLRVLVISAAVRGERWLDALRADGYRCDVIGDVAMGLSRVESVDDDPYDLLIWDTETPGMSSEEAIERGRPAVDIPTLLLMPRSKGSSLGGARRPGLFDLVTKPVETETLLSLAGEAVSVARARRLVAGLRASVAQVVSTLAEVESLLDGRGREGSSRAGGLSAREEEISAALAQGMRVPDIATRLGISQHTVRNHFKAIFRKLGVHSQVQLMAKLREREGPRA